jgi:hypothetical protein
MPWDPGVLRKYNSTGHFRLLNQIRSELKANPLDRTSSGALAETPSFRGNRPGRGPGWNRGATRRTSAYAPLSTDSFNRGDDGSANTAGSFRDRLNAIDMR